MSTNISKIAKNCSNLKHYITVILRFWSMNISGNNSFKELIKLSLENRDNKATREDGLKWWFKLANNGLKLKKYLSLFKFKMPTKTSHIFLTVLWNMLSLSESIKISSIKWSNWLNGKGLKIHTSQKIRRVNKKWKMIKVSFLRNTLISNASKNKTLWISAECLFRDIPTT